MNLLNGIRSKKRELFKFPRKQNILFVRKKKNQKRKWTTKHWKKAEKAP